MIVLIGGTAETNEITAVTYGGVALSAVSGSPNAKATGETGIVQAFFLGSGVPSGAQTVAYTTSGSTVTHQGYCVTVTATASTEVVATNVAINSDSQADPSSTLGLSGRTCFCCELIYSGQAAIASITPFSGWTSQHEAAASGDTLAYYTYDTVGSSDVTVGWTQTADDALMIAVAVSEVAGRVTKNTRTHPLGIAHGLMRSAVMAIVLWLWCPSALAQTVTHGLTIPDTSGAPVPLLYTSGTLATIQARYAASPSTYALIDYSGQGEPNEWRMEQQAFVYKMTGVCSSGDGGTATVVDTCDDAITWMVTHIPANSCPGQSECNWYEPLANGSDAARWIAEHQILTFSWLYPEMTAGERDTVITYINRAVVNALTKAYGDAEDIANNHGWGYERNALLWALTSYNLSFTMPATDCSWSGGYAVHPYDICGDTQQQIAEAILDEALTVRWTAFDAYFTDWRGGVAPDGTYYGRYFYGYFTIPMLVYRDYGRAIGEEVPFMIDAAWYLLVGTTPKSTYHTNTATTLYQLFAHGDHQNSGTSPTDGSEHAGFLTYITIAYDGTTLETAARKWLTDHNPPMFACVKVLDDERGATGTDLTALQLDYYAPGPGTMFARDTWANGVSDKPTVFQLLIGSIHGHHMHCDAGSWQAVRGDRWVSKGAETYNENLTGITGSGTVNGASMWGHNGVTVNNIGGSTTCFNNEPPVLRLDRTANYIFAATHLLEYLGAQASASALVREYVYVRALNTLVTFDRIVTSGTSTPKTSVVHCPVDMTNPSAGVYVCANGDERMKTIFLSDDITDQVASYLEVNERAGSCPHAQCDPQHRVQQEITGTTTSYLVSAHQAYTTGDTEMTASLAEDGDSITVTVTVGGSTAVMDFARGATSTGGSINLNGGGATAFDTGVDPFSTTTGGFAWGPAGNQTRVPFLRRQEQD